MNINTHVVIMAGGSGTRFWPYSRNAKPKQFLDVLGTGKTLLQMTFDRFKEIVPKDRIWIVSNKKYGNLVKEQLPQLESNQILLETEKRNTAPCIAYASYKIKKKNKNAVMIVTPSDHAIFNEKKFETVIQTAIKEAHADEKLITIGIRPNCPETGYGYIQYISQPEALIKKVKTFTEKPELELAKKFIESGDFLWNSGIFIWSTHSIIKSFEKYEEEIASLFEAGMDEFYTENEQNFIEEVYSQCKIISIDFAILEKADNVFVIPGEFGWSDIGSWNALHEIKEKDENENVVEGDALLYDSKNNYIKGEQGKIIVVQGCEGMLIADYDGVLVVCKKENSSIFRDFITDVRFEKGEEFI